MVIYEEGRRGERPREDDVGAYGDALAKAGFVFALAVLAFIAGVVFAAGRIFPGPEISRAYEAGKALYEKITGYDDVYVSDLWHEERRTERGVTVYIPERAQAGLTLYTSGHAAAAFLIDMHGEVLHQWRRPFSTVWDESAAVKDPQPDSHVYFRKARMFPNGDLLAIYEGVGDTPYGYGLVKLDRDSNVIWRYLAHTHHDFDVGPDGRIYVLTHEFVHEPLAEYEKLRTPRLDDFLVILSPEGQELQKIPLIRSVDSSPFRLLLHTVSAYAVGDPLHANSVRYITREQARNFAFGREGDLLLSFRELGAIAVLDPKSEVVTWATRGYWVGQHNPTIMPNGNILLFDNYHNFRRPEGLSRVIEIDPRTMAIVWQYRGTPKRPLDSYIRSEQERLPNGNTLITESNGGRLLEVTPSGEIVWEFLNPVRGGPDGDRIPIVNAAQRIDPRGIDPVLLDPDNPGS